MTTVVPTVVPSPTIYQRAKLNAPEWFIKEENITKPKEKPYWKIRLVLSDLHHDGYCSGTEEEECETMNYIYYRYVNELETGMEVGLTWNFPLSCQHDEPDVFDLEVKSGYCDLTSKASVSEITYIV